MITQAGTHTYSIDPVENAAKYEWAVSNPNWTINGTGRQISLLVQGGGTGILSAKAIHENGICYTEKTLQIQSTVSVSETENDNNIRIYPNPTTGKFTIHISQFTFHDIEIYDIYGKKLSHFTFHTSPVEIDISHLANGVYFLKIGDKTEKILKY